MYSRTKLATLHLMMKLLAQSLYSGGYELPITTGYAQLGSIAVTPQTMEDAIDIVRTKLACSFEAAVDVVESLFHNAGTADLVLGNRPHPEAEVPDDVEKVYVTMEEQLYFVKMGLNTEHTIEDMKQFQLEIAHSFIDSRYPVIEAGQTVPTPGKQGKLWETHRHIGNCVKVVFHCLGDQGVRYLNRFIGIVLNDNDGVAGINPTLQAARKARQYRGIRGLYDFQCSFSLSASSDSARTVDLQIVNNYASAQAYDRQEFLIAELPRLENRVLREIVREKINIEAVGPSPRAQIQAFLAKENCRNIDHFKKHMQLCRTMAYIRSAAPWAMLMITPVIQAM